MLRSKLENCTEEQSRSLGITEKNLGDPRGNTALTS